MLFFVKPFQVVRTAKSQYVHRHAARWEAGGAPPDFGRSEGAFQIFDPYCIPGTYQILATNMFVLR